MGLQADQLPSVLRSESIDGWIDETAEEIFDGGDYKALRYFDQKVASSGRLREDIVKWARTLTALHGAPRSPERRSRKDIGRLDVSPFFLAETYEVGVDDMTWLKMPGEPQSNLVGLKRREAAENLAEGLDAIVDSMLRTKNVICAKILSQDGRAVGSSTPITIKVDGVDINLTGPIPDPVASPSDWTVKTSDIPGEMNQVLLNATRSLRGTPTDAFISPEFIAQYIAKNDEAREFFVRNRDLSKDGDAKQWMFIAMGFPVSMNVHVVWDDYEDSNGAVQQAWPTDRITFTRKVSGRRNKRSNFVRATVPTFDNDHQGGMRSYVQVKQEPPAGVFVHVTDNEIPYVRSTTSAYVLDVTGP